MNRIEAVLFYGIYSCGRHGRAISRSAKCTVLHATASTAGNLRYFLREERAGCCAVKFGKLGKRNMVHIHVQPHPDGIGGHQVIDFPVLVELDLGVSRPWAELPHDDGTTTSPASYDFGQSVNF
ncbi:hypothetical protein AA0229_2541 [Gluconobacter cerinus NRIC 0229]|nr:hypothetical protein AA0229_2541 [Gluconobacter cerinus NRIC 0229]